MHILVPYSSGCAAVCPGVFRLQVGHGNLQEKVRQWTLSGNLCKKTGSSGTLGPLLNI